MTEASSRRAHIVSDFKDAGTGETFAAGHVKSIDAGAYANYEAAGLVRAPTATKATPASKPKSKPRAKAIAKSPTPAPASTEATDAS